MTHMGVIVMNVYNIQYGYTSTLEPVVIQVIIPKYMQDHVRNVHKKRTNYVIELILMLTFVK